MQLFVRCGVPFGTITVDCALSDTVNDLKDRLSAKIAQLGPCRFMVSVMLLALLVLSPPTEV